MSLHDDNVDNVIALTVLWDFLHNETKKKLGLKGVNAVVL